MPPSDEPRFRSIIISGEINDEIAEDVIQRVSEINEDDAQTEQAIANTTAGLIQRMSPSPEKTTEILSQLEYKRQPIDLVVNSEGGDVHSGLAIIGAIETSITPVHTFVTGKAMSMALFISACGHYRYAHRLATFMYHESYGWNEGTIEDQKAALHEHEKIQKTLAEFLIGLTKLKKTQLEKYKTKDWYFDAEQALKYGVIDEILPKSNEQGSK